MKNLFNKTAVLFCLTLVFTLFSYNTAEAQSDNANVVTIDNGQTWVWIADNCAAPLVEAESARVQSSKHFYHVTTTFQLPEGHCDIPEKGSVTVRYDENNWATITSKGKVKAKNMYNKKDF